MQLPFGLCAAPGPRLAEDRLARRNAALSPPNNSALSAQHSAVSVSQAFPFLLSHLLLEAPGDVGAGRGCSRRLLNKGLGAQPSGRDRSRSGLQPSCADELWVPNCLKMQLAGLVLQMGKPRSCVTKLTANNKQQ